MIRTVEQYLESLRDGRVIYDLGERVKDVTTHPVLRRVIQGGAMDWVLTNDPERRDLFVTRTRREKISISYGLHRRPVTT